LKAVAGLSEWLYSLCMKVAPKVYIPIPWPAGTQLKAGMDLSPASCEFELCEGPDKTIFFECKYDGCAGAGLREFPADYLYVPEEIVEDMRLHAALWHIQ